MINEGSKFPGDAASVDQFFRQMTPDTGMSSDMGGDFDNEAVAKALAATVDEVYSRKGKKSILATHSQGGGPGWTAAQFTGNIAATGMWQGVREACYQFAEAYTAAGGIGKVVDLPKEGITGNDHFMFQDLNNDVVADHVEAWIQDNVKEQSQSSGAPQSSTVSPQPETPPFALPLQAMQRI